MNISNLKINQIIKNYKELCELLGIEASAGNTKKSQLKELECYCKYEKQGQKFIIKEIFESPKEKEDLRKYNGGDHNNLEYIQYIEALILNLLAEKDSGIIFLSKYMMLNKLKMINENYSFCKSRIPKLSQYTNINKDNIYEFYDTTDGTLLRNLERALNNLKDKSLVKWSKELTVCECVDTGFSQVEDNVYVDSYNEEYHIYKNRLDLNYRQASDSEAQLILYYEKEVLTELGFSKKQELIRNKKWNLFKDKVKEKLLPHNIIFYYESYKIIFNEDHIYEEITEIYDLLLTKSEKEENENKLNLAIIERLKDNVQKRKNRNNDKLKNIFGLIKNEKELLRNNENYIPNNDELIKLLINKESKNIKQIIKKQKLNTIETS